MSAPLNNQNGAKPDAERASSVIHCACTPADKGLFNLAAQEWAERNNVNDRRGPFTMWALSVLRAAVPQSVHDLVKRKQDEARKISKRR